MLDAGLWFLKLVWMLEARSWRLEYDRLLEIPAFKLLASSI